jgi:hypothetical protein
VLPAAYLRPHRGPALAVLALHLARRGGLLQGVPGVPEAGPVTITPEAVHALLAWWAAWLALSILELLIGATRRRR